MHISPLDAWNLVCPLQRVRFIGVITPQNRAFLLKTSTHPVTLAFKPGIAATQLSTSIILTGITSCDGA